MPRARRFHPDSSSSSDSSGTPGMRCNACEERYVWRNPCFCKKCYEKVSKTAEENKRERERYEKVSKTAEERYEQVSRTAEEYKREIEDLKAKNFFLRLWIQTDPNGLGFTDVVLVAAIKNGPNGGQSKPVPAHRAILVSRSPVFKAMLENEMEHTRSSTSTIKLSSTSTIKISSTYDVLQAFVNYLYSAEACLDEQMACDLLALAEKYQVEHLKAYCEKFLVSKLNQDNSIIRYAFAHHHNAKLLLQATLSLIIDNMDNLRKDQEMSELIEKEPRLVLKIYEAWITKQKNSTGTC